MRWCPPLRETTGRRQTKRPVTPHTSTPRSPGTRQVCHSLSLYLVYSKSYSMKILIERTKLYIMQFIFPIANLLFNTAQWFFKSDKEEFYLVKEYCQRKGSNKKSLYIFYLKVNGSVVTILVKLLFGSLFIEGPLYVYL